MSKKIPSGYEKRKKKTEEQEKLLKFPKISSFFSSTIPCENKSEIIIKSVNTEVNSEQSVELSSVDSEKSEESAPEMLSCCSYKGTNQNESFDIVFKNIIETSSDPTDIGHFKEIVLDAQTKRFIIENGHSRPKAKGPFAKNSDGRSFSEKEKLGSGKGENGNFICFIELLAKYDPVLEKVINQGNNKVNYCSPKIQNELIQLISNKVEDELILNIKETPFFSIIIDTTQDISKVDQLSEIYRYCVIEKDEYGNPKNVCVKEIFLAFHEVVDQSASSLSELILQNIEKKDCLSPSVVVRAMTGLPIWVVFVNDAVKEILEMEIFFDVVQRVFVFFGHSIVRWRILSDLIKESNSQNGLLINKLNPTRWAGRYEAVFALKIRFVEIQKALTKVILCSSKLDEPEKLTLKI
ncbi:hypothetical protein QTP88_001600 [Uroleucon formosanum]